MPLDDDPVPGGSPAAFLAGARADARSTWRFGQCLYYLHLTCRVAALAGAGALPALAGYRAHAWTVAIAVAVLACEVVLRVVQPGDHAINQIRKGNELRRALRLFDAGVHPYAGADRVQQLVAHVEAVRLRNDLAEERVLAATVSSSAVQPDPDTVRLQDVGR